MEKLLVICGPTATGKTSLALRLAKMIDGELISADSRQVYRGMDIGTGKDIPKNFKFRISNLDYQNDKIAYYTNGKIRLWGYDLVDPTKEFSVASYVAIAGKIMENIWKRGKLPILTGGTGFYIKGLVDGIDTLEIPKDMNLRFYLENKSVSDLQSILKKVNPEKHNKLNLSDVKNPRRLVRSIEIAIYRKHRIRIDVDTMMDNDLQPRIKRFRKFDTLFIGLMAPIYFLEKRIGQRVEDRLNEGLENEIRNLLEYGVGWNTQAMQTLGYRQWRDCFEDFRSNVCKNSDAGEAEVAGNTERQDAIKEWKMAEKNYAKRQMTWFKKDERIMWFDVSSSKWKEGVEKAVKEWHN